MKPCLRCTVVYPFLFGLITATAFHASAIAIQQNDTGTPLLVAEIRKAKEKCEQADGFTTCKFKLFVNLHNEGDGPQPPTHVSLLFSGDEVFDEGVDEVIADFEIGEIRAGHSKKLRTKEQFDRRHEGQFLLVVDENGGVLASLQIPVPSQRPDLGGTWEAGSPIEDCRFEGEERVCDISGVLNVQNSGNGVSASAVVRFYTSASLGVPADELGNGYKTGKIRAGEIKQIKFKAEVRGPSFPGGRSVLVLIDPRNLINETEEDDNIVVTDPFP